MRRNARPSMAYGRGSPFRFNFSLREVIQRNCDTRATANTFVLEHHRLQCDMNENTTDSKERNAFMQHITPHLWFDTQAKEAAEFYTSILPDSKITHIT